MITRKQLQKLKDAVSVLSQIIKEQEEENIAPEEGGSYHTETGKTSTI